MQPLSWLFVDESVRFEYMLHRTQFIDLRVDVPVHVADVAAETNIVNIV